MRTKSLCDSCSVYDCVWRAPVYNGIPVLAECHNYTPKPQTNYDCIINKTLDELANWIVSQSPGICPGDRLCNTETCPDISCKECWLEYLRKETNNGVY